MFYKIVISPVLGNNCRFNPTCSNYGIEVLRTFGLFDALLLIIIRILKCHPFHSCGNDPVPFKRFTIENNIDGFATKIFIRSFFNYVSFNLARLGKRKNHSRCKNCQNHRTDGDTKQ